MPTRQDITGLVLAGGQGSRMGGLDKGLQILGGRPLVERCLDRLRPQVATVAINANRNRDRYARWPHPVWPDVPTGSFQGPLAGFLAGMTHCQTPYLCTVPCDSPFFPADLVQRLARGLEQAGVDLAVVETGRKNGRAQTQATFCLMKTSLREALMAFWGSGQRKVDAWIDTLQAVRIPFGPPDDEHSAFLNINTLQQLDQLERSYPA